MSDSRTDILAALRAARPPAQARPEAAPRPAAPHDPIAEFAASVAKAGGRVERGEAATLVEALNRIPGFEAATHCWSGIADLASRGLAHDADQPGALEGLEFCVLPGELGVAESGAVWSVPADRLERAAALLCEHLVLVLPAASIVANLHDAYARIDPAAAGFGWFLAGPSKTADIEQSLVLGAHGARALSVVLR